MKIVPIIFILIWGYEDYLKPLFNQFRYGRLPPLQCGRAIVMSSVRWCVYGLTLAQAMHKHATVT